MGSSITASVDIVCQAVLEEAGDSEETGQSMFFKVPLFKLPYLTGPLSLCKLLLGSLQPLCLCPVVQQTSLGERCPDVENLLWTHFYEPWLPIRSSHLSYDSARRKCFQNDSQLCSKQVASYPLLASDWMQVLYSLCQSGGARGGLQQRSCWQERKHRTGQKWRPVSLIHCLYLSPPKPTLTLPLCRDSRAKIPIFISEMNMSRAHTEFQVLSPIIAAEELSVDKTARCDFSDLSRVCQNLIVVT